MCDLAKGELTNLNNFRCAFDGAWADLMTA
jgi:hypothetical protein